MPFKGIQVIINGIDKLSPVIDSPMKKLEKMGTAFSKIGKMATIGLTLPIIAAGAASVKSAVDLNASMANVATLIPETGKRIYDLRDNVQSLSMETGKAGTDIAGGLYQVISAFGDSADTAKRLEINVKAAKAGLSSTSEAILFTGAVTKAYGDTSAAAMQKVADLGFQTVRLGVTTFPELAGSIGRVTPLAKTMGVNLEELFGVMATLTGVTGDTAEVSTQMSGILAAMIKPTAELESLFKFLGYSSGQAMIKELGFAKSLQTMVGMADKAGVSIGKLFGRKEAMIGALALTGAQANDFANKMDAMKNSSGALDKAFKAQTEGINKTGHSFDILKTKVVAMGQKIGEKLLPVLDSLFTKISPVIDKIMDMQPEALQLIIIVGGLAAAIGPLILAFSSCAMSIVMFYKAFVQIPMAIKAVSVAIKGLGMVLQFFTANPVGLALLAIGLVIYNIILLKKHWKDLTDIFSSKFMVLQTLSFFLADIYETLGHIIAFIPGLGKLAEYFKLSGKGFEIYAQERAQKEFGQNAIRSRERVGTEGIYAPPIGARTPEVERAAREKKERSELLVKFQNAPKGMRIEEVKEGGLNLETELGTILSGAY